MRLLTYTFYQYARVRTWMERAPRAERWQWYGWMAVWLGTVSQII